MIKAQTTVTIKDKNNTPCVGPKMETKMGKSSMRLRGTAALLHKSKAERGNPSPRRSYAMATTGTVVGRPSCVKRLSSATRTCNSTT